ncbi:MAG: flagellar basal-body rod protein FlgF [Planctomycetota bacterium]|jgi:flagellar basal-body rod protein FlgF
MNESLYIAASGMTAVQRMLDSATHNTVNAQTPGYQKHEMVLKNFDAFLGDAGKRGGLIGSEERIAFSQGQLRNSDNPLALALNGDGFLVVSPPNHPGEVFFTRNGDLSVNPDGELVTRAGYNVLDDAEEPIKVDPVNGPVFYSENGDVVQGGEPLSRLQVVEFTTEERSKLTAVGETLFRSAENYRPPLTEGDTVVKHGLLEFPKDAGVKGLINMLMANKNYEAMQKAIRSLDSVNENLLRNSQ